MREPDSGVQGVVIDTAWVRGGTLQALLETEDGEFHLINVTHLVSVENGIYGRVVESAEVLRCCKNLAEAAFAVASGWEKGQAIDGQIKALRVHAEKVAGHLKSVKELLK